MNMKLSLLLSNLLLSSTAFSQSPSSCPTEEFIVESYCYTSYIWYYLSHSGSCKKTEMRVPTGKCSGPVVQPPDENVYCDYDSSGNGPYGCDSSGGGGLFPPYNPNSDPCDRDEDGTPQPGCGEGPGGATPEI
ncbi:hypothetical protein [Empedobacter brevis]|uniref:hypothetical protein n=1 Tax=Empedobacter brevis TaxID=247 RepID=UPI002FE0BE16